MDDAQQRISEDLAGLFQGELRFDDATRQAYATDASLYEILPLGVAAPRHQEDVELLARYAQENSIPLIARGAGTGLAGGALGTGLIVDFSSHLRQIVRIDSDSVTVQPGVVREQLNLRLKEFGRYFAPDPSNSSVTTIGGMIGVDAAGSHAARVGSTRDHVQSLRGVLAGGQAIELGPVVLDASSRLPEGDENPVWLQQELARSLAYLLETHATLIQERQPPLLRNSAGYYLRSVLQDQIVHLERLIVGSEGTLALVTEATLHTVPLPSQRGCMLLLFGSLEAAIRAVHKISEQQPSACDLLDRRLISMAREADRWFEELIPPTAEAALLVEQTGYSRVQVLDRLRAIGLAAREVDSAMLIRGESAEAADVERLWSLPQRVVPLLTGLRGQTRPLPFVEDIAVPPEQLHDFLIRAHRVFQKYQVTASLYAHAASGQVHLRPFLPWPTAGTAGILESIARELYEVVFAHGGTISGEHGDGLSRTSFLRSQYGPLYRVFKEIKELFDPRNLLNPGKIISDDPHLTVKNLRVLHPVSPETTESTAPLVQLQLRWEPESAAEAVSRCNGCGNCRTQSVAQRMCPFFHLEPIEAFSPRSKANLLRGVLNGSIAPREMTTEQAKELSDSCFNCRQCVLECPAHVDIPGFVEEFRASYVAAHGLTRADWALSRATSFGRLGTALAPLANWALNNRPFRWLLERLIGIARGRRLPQFANRTFLSMAKRTLSDRRRVLDGKRPVVFFVDHYVNYHDPELGWALVAILQHNGIQVYVPPQQAASGMAMITAGDVDAARELALANLRAFGDLAREGLTILCTEPTAAVCLKHDYPRLVDHPDVAALSQQVVEAGAFLRSLLQQGRLRTDFTPLQYTAAYHTPCHLRSLENGTPLADLLGRIPELKLERIEKGCSGMAGAFGLTQRNFETSLKIGEGLMTEMQRPDLQFGVTECSGCKLQMEQRTTHPTIHPLKLLALAYGYMPELKHKLGPNRRLLTVRS